MKIEAMKESLYSGLWGTIGPRFLEASEEVAKKSGGNYGVLMHSATAAYETVLRSLDFGHGDRILCAVYADRMDAEVAAGIGMTPVFADIKKETLAISVKLVETILSSCSEIRALVVDYSTDLELSAIKEICKAHSCALIVNAGGALDVSFDFDGIYAVIYDFGICGAAVADKEDDYRNIFAWHHCGHAPGTAASIRFDAIVGGDMRASEWQALETLEIIKESHPATPLRERGYFPAWQNEAFKTDYFRKMTGFEGDYKAEDYPNASTVLVRA